MGPRGCEVRVSHSAPTTAGKLVRDSRVLPDVANFQPNACKLCRRLVLVVYVMLLFHIVPQATVAEEDSFDSKRAFDYLLQICRIGPRPSGSRGMVEQQRLITQHFAQFGPKIQYQSFDVAHPVNGNPVRMTNIIVSWHPKAVKRVLLACHYDTRPFPDRDLFNPRGRFVGANDGASGVAFFMELAHHMQRLKPVYGVDFVFFDGEELVYSSRDKYFLGSEHFARNYRDQPPNHRYVFGVLVDMIADKNLNIYKEKNSLKYAAALTESIWATARRQGVRNFKQSSKYEVNDDHIPLNQIANIPTCDIIDFDYRYWHKTRDLPSACSGESLRKVARVLTKWLTEIPAR